MNEPLKPKLWSLYGKLLNKELLNRAWKRVKANKGTAGIDRIYIEDFEENLDAYLEEIGPMSRFRTKRIEILQPQVS